MLFATQKAPKSTRSVLSRKGHRRKAEKGFNLFCARLLFVCAVPRFEKPRSFPERETDCHFLRRAKSNQKACSDVQKVAGGKFLCVGDRRNRENCERT